MKRLFLNTFPNNEKKVESTTCSAVFLTNPKVFGNVVKNGLRCLNDVSCQSKLKLGRKERNEMEIIEMLIRSDIQHAKKTNLQVCITMYQPEYHSYLSPKKLISNSTSMYWLNFLKTFAKKLSFPISESDDRIR